MNKLTAVMLTIAGVIFVFFISLAVGYLGFSNSANAFEVDIKAVYTNNQNVYDNGWKKIKEVSQVPELQTASLKEIYTAALQSRYGDDGSKALLQFIHEQNPSLDQTTFIKIQQDIEAFRNEFQSNQTRLVSVKQTYERFLTATTSGRFYNMFANYPRIDLAKYDIVTSERTQKAFDTKQDDPIKLR